MVMVGWLTTLLSRWRARKQRNDRRRLEAVENQILLELRRASSMGVASFVTITVLSRRLRLSPSQLQPALDQLAARQLIQPGPKPGTYRMCE